MELYRLGEIMSEDAEESPATTYPAWEHSPLPRGKRDRYYWIGLIGPAFFPLFFSMVVFFQIADTFQKIPVLDSIFGGDDLLILSMCNLFLSVLAWPFIAFNLPPPYNEGGKASGAWSLTLGFFLFLWVMVLFSYIGAS